MHKSADKMKGFTIQEMLLVILAIGILSAIALPTVGNLSGRAKVAKTKNNAQRIQTVSNTLASLGVAHVIPESMGGVEATIRLLREGLNVDDPLMTEGFYQVPGLTDTEVALAAQYLDVVYDLDELRLIYDSSGI